jgi:O-acetyl-ADP-ribose deacetylase (regulator of RNase III)
MLTPIIFLPPLLKSSSACLSASLPLKMATRAIPLDTVPRYSEGKTSPLNQVDAKSTNTTTTSSEALPPPSPSPLDVDDPLRSAFDSLATNSSETTPFPFNPELNHKIRLFQGFGYQVQLDTLMIATNESFTERSGMLSDIWTLCDPALTRRVKGSGADKIRTGEVMLTPAPPLSCSSLLHAVGPRYNEQYKTAAENALHFCYRNALRVCKEQKFNSIGITAVYTRRKRYPREAAVHIVLRTLRRFMNKFPEALEDVVLCMEDLEDQQLYAKLLPLYFPRSREEEKWAWGEFTSNNVKLGDEDGETVIEERKIRING